MGDMQRYTLCFIFSEDLREVILIKKNKPVWQSGNYNGVGGKIEPNEESIDGVVREVFEEIDIKLTQATWFKELSGEDALDLDWVVDCYSAVINKEDNPINNKTDEIAKWFRVDKLPKNKLYEVQDLVLNAWSNSKGVKVK